MYEMFISDEKSVVQFPVAPAKMTMKIKNQNKSITLINEGEVNLIKSPGLTEITIDELLIPALQKYPFAVYKNNEFHTVKYYLTKLEKWKKSKKPVKFKMVRYSPNREREKLMWDTKMDVTIESYEIIEDAERNGCDVKIKLNMKEYRYWGAKKLVKKKSKSNSKSKTSGTLTHARKTKTSATEYVVKKGDCLITIARKQLNDGSKWKKIYELNKKTIENEARKHGRKSSSNGHWIYPGTKLKLPK